MKPIYTNPCPFVTLSAKVAVQDDLEPEVEHCAIFARVPDMSLRLAATPLTADAMALAAELVTEPWPPDLPGLLFEIVSHTRAWPVQADASDMSELVCEWSETVKRWNEDRSEHLAKLAGRPLHESIAVPWDPTEPPMILLSHYLSLAQAGVLEVDSRVMTGATGAALEARMWWAWAMVVRS